jgi:hypothetical protein
MRFRNLALVSLLLLPIAASAVSFPDVKTSDSFSAAVSGLADLGVIGGNPDGTFRPHDPVDRASILKMLYKAAGLVPGAPAADCFTKFTDVPRGVWFASYVCDAAARGFVKGYDGNLFKPSRPVSRAEALKLTVVILGLFQENWKSGSNYYTDVGSNDWFVSFVTSANGRGVLPIPEKMDGKLYPNAVLERGEAAMYIWNGLHAFPVPEDSRSASSAPAQVQAQPQASSSAKPGMDDKRAQQRAAEAATMAQDKANMKNVSFPFSDQRLFTLRQPLTYSFHLTATTTMSIESSLGGAGSLSCRLYRLGADGFSTEYYLGSAENASCSLLVTAEAGDYQLLLEPSVINASLTVSAKAATGDGNDGFSQAKSLELTGRVVVSGFDANDLDDWYTFKVSATDPSVIATGSKTMTVTVTSSPQAGCAIYPLADVDLFGFAGPGCNQSYAFPPGTYMVDLRHPFPKQSKMTYSVSVK